MKNIIKLPHVAALVAALSLAPLSIAQPPPGGPGGPGGPGFGPGGPGPGPRPPLPIIPLLPPEPLPPRRTVESSYSSTTAKVQRKLKNLGYYSGSVDGEIGPRTRAAIRAYQEENSLDVTGRIDRALLASLGI